MLYAVYCLLGALAVVAGLCWAMPGADAAPTTDAYSAATMTTRTTSTVTMSTTTATTTTFIQTRDITFVTAETRGSPIIEKVGNFDEAFNTRVVNAGEGKKWDGYKSKVKMLQKYLHKRLKDGDGDELVAFVDGSDVIWGGCDPGYFQHAYEEIVAKSGAPVVFSAELVCGEQDCNKVPPVPDWAVETAGGKDLNGGFWERFVDGCKATWTDQCSDKRDCGGLAACSEPPAVKFLNSGFTMGPVKEVSAMMDWSLDNYDEYSVWGDQSVFAVYWLANQDKVTLDYTGALAASISDLRWEVLEAPLSCKLNQWVYVISHRDMYLADIKGKVGFTKTQTSAAQWILTSAGHGKYFISSFAGRQLVDNDKFVDMSIFTTKTEMWKMSVGGGGVVYLTSSQGEQLQDDNGHAIFSMNKQGWESWRIHTLDGTPACVETRPKDGVVMNFGFNRKQCLIHGNGRGFWFFKHIVMMLTNQTVDEVRNWGHHHKLHTR